MNQDILIEVLSHLPLKDKVNSSLVCKEWYHTNKYIYTNQIVKVSTATLKSETFQKWFEKHKCFIEITEPINIENIPNYIYNYIVHIRMKGLNCSSSSISELKQLRFLAVVFNQLTHLPSSICELKQLRELYLGRNHLTLLPETIGNLKNLQYLCLNSNDLTQLPESIGELKNLQDLNLSGNQLTQLPDTIGNLKNLQNITMLENIMTTTIGWLLGIPMGIWFLKQYVATFTTIRIEYTAYINWQVLIIASLLVWFTSICTTFIISRRIRKIDMVEALKGVE